jgi:CheY-like chemotaxis protein
MERRRLTLGQAAREAGVTPDELRCAIVNGQLLGEVSENTGVFMIDSKSLELYLKSTRTVRPDERRRVLIIDDEINFGNLVKTDLMRDRRVDARFASWGRDGLKMAAEFKPQLVLMDFVLPDTTGEELLAEIRNLHSAGTLRVIVYSAHVEDTIKSDPRLSARLAQLGADLFISKTVGLKALVQKVKEMLGLAAASPAA